MTPSAPHIRFRKARERSGLSQDEVAARSGISSSCVWDIETIEDEITSCYSPKQVRRICQVIGVQTTELFGTVTELPISAKELVERIQSECLSRRITLEEFEDVVGWRLTACIQPPDKLLEDMTVDGLQWLCRELRIDWRRVLLDIK